MLVTCPSACALLILGLSGTGAVRTLHLDTTTAGGSKRQDDSTLLVVKNADVRSFLEKQTLKGPMVNHPNYSVFPVKGVFMFQDLGPAALVDFSYAKNWEMEKNTFELDISRSLFQSGMPWKHAGIGPYIPGTMLAKTFAFVGYHALFRCPENPILDDQHCVVDASVWGQDYPPSDSPSDGGAQYFVKHEGGRLWHRRTTRTGGMDFHSYWLRRVVDESGKIDEENFNMLMEKLGGQDLVTSSPSA